MKSLSIEVIHAHSPQAKGRVERANKTLQDRLIKEMRLAGISSMQQGNHFVQTSNFIDEHNRRFAVPPETKGYAHRPTQNYNLDALFCIQEQRTVANDYTVTYKKRILQLTQDKPAFVKPKTTVTIKTALNGEISVFSNKTKLEFTEIAARQLQDKPITQTKEYMPRKPSINSQRWVAGLPPSSTENKTTRRVG